MKTEPLVIERTYHSPVTRVWKAITDTNDMNKWSFHIAEFKPEVGFEFQFYGGPKDKQYKHICKVTEAIVNQKLSYTWRYDGYGGDSIVTFELLSEGSTQTRLKLTHTALETFPATNPDFAKENFVQGWTELIGSLLKKFVETGE